MAPGTRHRARALVSSVLDGVVVGAGEAALDHPKRSPARRRTYAALAGAVLADAALSEVPTVRAIAAGRPPRPVSPPEQQLGIAAGLVSVGWGLLTTVVDGPLARALARRGVARPHLVLGVAAGAVTAVSTLPLWWRRGTLRIAADERQAREDADVAAWEAELAEVER
ncbi:hypothetical protein [Klenkia brasiliensis]|uniref:Uncharacterized protein n=1 Tax=Klenkia brasiliensis TaxID=333142 RepID=A0A1G7VMF4_9ACTN|nr:hypothetical protein [Klenkia brasiliensis]SDG60953.1 hypothetical protein SAMN05660324_3131 [Klenkia brasiliensis]